MTTPTSSPLAASLGIAAPVVSIRASSSSWDDTAGLRHGLAAYSVQRVEYSTICAAVYRMV